MKLGQIIKELANHFAIRAALCVSMPFLAGLFGNMVSVSTLYIVLTVVFSIVALAVVVYYAYQDNEKEKEKKYIEDLNLKLAQEKEYEDTLINNFKAFEVELEKVAGVLSRIAKEASSSGKMDLRHWNKCTEYDFICNQLYQFVNEIAKKGNNFSVSVICAEENPKTHQDEYIMVSRRSYSGTKPKIYESSVTPKKAKDYFYYKLMTKKDSKPVFLMTNDEIRKVFHFSSEASEAILKEYNQYIGIPITCSGNHTVALLQIIAHQESIISSDKDKLIDITNKIIYTFVKYGLFCEKIEKALLAKSIE